MRSYFWIIGAMSALAAAGCADQFRTQSAPRLVQEQEPIRSGSTRLTVAPLPPDVAWLTEAVRLFESTETGAAVQLTRGSTEVGAGASSINAAAVAGAVGSPPGGRREGHNPGADVQVVSLPLTAEQAAGLTAVPREIEAAVGPSLLPQAMTAAQVDGTARALPVSARWLTLAWNPARLSDSAAPVPPHLEAWMDHLRALRQKQPGQPPVIAAWAEPEIAGSFALLLAAHGGRLLDEAGYPAFASAEGEAAVQFMIRLLEERLVQPTALATDTRRLAASLTGPYAYWLCSSDALNAVPTGSERLTSLRLSGLPVVRARYRYPETTAATLVQFRGIAVSRDSARPAAAWRLARFLGNPVVLRSAPAAASVLTAPPASVSPLVGQSRALIAQSSAVPWPDVPGLNEALGRFLHAALRRILTPREALERAALQLRQPGALPESSDAAHDPGPPTGGYPSSPSEPGVSDSAPAGPGSGDTSLTPAPGTNGPSIGPNPQAPASPGAPGGYPAPGSAYPGPQGPAAAGSG